jgi:hypothetical protein
MASERLRRKSACRSRSKPQAHSDRESRNLYANWTLPHPHPQYAKLCIPNLKGASANKLCAMASFGDLLLSRRR